MTYYSIQNPLGSILYFVDSYNLSDEKQRREKLLDWFNHQSPTYEIGQRNDIYDKFDQRFNLDLKVLDEIFAALGWMTYYVIAVLEEKITQAFKIGIIKNISGKVELTKLGKHLFENNEYNQYLNSIHFKANFWKNNNVKITDNSNIGSGFFIEPNSIITCEHVYNKLTEEKIHVEDESGKKYTILQIIRHPNNSVDMLKLVTKEPFEFFVYEIESNISLTERVIVFGYPPIPLSSKPFLLANLGEISSIVDNYIDGTDCLFLSCILRPGNSGGPIINEQGKLIGMMVQNRSLKTSLTWDDMDNMDLNKGLGFATGLNAKYILEF